MSQPFSHKMYITTPLYYVNAVPHLGHAYTTFIADVLKKHSLQRGRETLFLTGTDEHGEKISQKARDENMDEKAFVDMISGKFHAAWEALNLDPDVFYRTTSENHKKMVSTVLTRLKEQEKIYFAEYEGNYCVGCERFLTDQELDEVGNCPDHKKPPEKRKEGNYFFKMSDYQKDLIEFYEKNSDAILPTRYRNEVLSMLKEPLGDLSISRPKSRVKWGIPLPFDEEHVTYVWFDALLNYVGGIGFDGSDSGGPLFNKELWENSVHLIGKDILKTHAVYWPTMLMGMGMSPARRLQVGGFWISEGAKMSKSLGNVVDPLEITKNYGLEAFRYYLLSEASYGEDANFTMSGFVTRTNAELANGLGNLASRSLTLIKKNFDSSMPELEDAHASADTLKASVDLIAQVHQLPKKFSDAFDEAKFQQAVKAFAETVALCDKYVNDNAPWALAKDESKRSELSVVLATLANALWTLSAVVFPLTPEASLKLRAALGDESGEVPLLVSAEKLIKTGTKFGDVPRLFPRLELPKDS